MIFTFICILIIVVPAYLRPTTGRRRPLSSSANSELHMRHCIACFPAGSLAMFSSTVKLVANDTCNITHEFGKFQGASRGLNLRALPGKTCQTTREPRIFI